MLGGRIIGVGRRGLNVFHAMVGLGLPPHKFNSVHEDLLVTIEFIGKGTMEKATIELEDSHGRAEDGPIHEIASFDGAYQKRSTKGGGGYSRYCIGSVISMTLGKILAYEVACNSCRECTRLANMVENNTTEKENTISCRFPYVHMPCQVCLICERLFRERTVHFYIRASTW